MIKAVITFALLLAVNTAARLFFKLKNEWITPEPENYAKGTRMGNCYALTYDDRILAEFARASKIAIPELKPAEPRQPFGRCPRPRPRDEQWADEYGPDFPGAAWETHTEAFDIAAAARPAGDEPVVTDGWQLNGLCRRLDVDTLVYVGFMADICLMNSSGAIREMSARFGYRCVVLRDCTVAYEFADSHKDGWMTRAAIRLIETGPGYSASSEDFIAACRAAAGN